MFHTISEQKKLFLGILLGALLFFMGVLIFFFIREFTFSHNQSGIFFPLISIEFVSNSNELLRIINKSELEKFSRFQDLSLFLLFIISAYTLLIFDFFKFEFLRLKKILFYTLTLSFILISIVEYFFWFHFTTSNKQEMIFDFKIFSSLIVLKWLFFFLSMAFLGFVVWLEARFYLLKITGFFYISAFIFFLLHFKIQQLIDLSLILISLGFIGNWFYFVIQTIQLKGVKK